MEVSACDLARIESCGGHLTVGAMIRERLAERSADVTKSVPLPARMVLTGAPGATSSPVSILLAAFRSRTARIGLGVSTRLALEG